MNIIKNPDQQLIVMYWSAILMSALELALIYCSAA
jgi:hypothetical protein